MDCVHHPGADAPYQCCRCREYICVDCETKVEGQSYCRSCLANVYQRLSTQYAGETRNVNFPLALLSGAAAAGAAAFLFARSAVWLNFPLPFWPALLGGAVGWAVVSGTGGKRGPKLQNLALVLSLLGMIAGLFLIAYQMAAWKDFPGAEGFNSDISATLSTFPTYLTRKVGPLAWFFVLVGLGWAWYVPHARTVPD